MSFELALFIIADAGLVGGILLLCFPDQAKALNEDILPSWCIWPVMNTARVLRIAGGLFVVGGATAAGFLVARL